MFSVIIPTYHRNDLLALCLNCLKPGVQTLDSTQFEVIVSDDGQDTTAQQLIADHYPWARWVRGSQRGPAANRNSGASQAQNKWLIFTDDDCLPDAKWLAIYSQATQDHPDINVFEGRTIADRPRLRYDEEAPLNETGGNLWSCNFAIKLSLFNTMKGFDEMFPYPAMEDIDLNTRLLNRKVKVKFLSNALIIHPYRRINPRNFSKTYQSTKYYWQKHGGITIKYRLGHCKHFIHFLFVKLLILYRFRFAGWRVYMREHQLLLRVLFLRNNKVQ